MKRQQKGIRNSKILDIIIFFSRIDHKTIFSKFSKEKTFTDAKTPQEMENLYNYLVNTEKDWLKEHYEPSQSATDIQNLDEIHKSYCAWCDKENIPSQTKSGLASTIYFMWIKPENTWTSSETKRERNKNITTYKCLKEREY